jgi:hypothetical protein
MHYLIVHPERLPLVHHRRLQDGGIRTDLVTSGLLTLDPPGLTFNVDGLLG